MTGVIGVVDRVDCVDEADDFVVLSDVVVGVCVEDSVVVDC